jgi:hypothetical protein
MALATQRKTTNPKIGSLTCLSAMKNYQILTKRLLIEKDRKLANKKGIIRLPVSTTSNKSHKIHQNEAIRLY